MAKLVDLPAGRQARSMYYLYILKSLKENYYYKEITDNLERRLSQHFMGKSPSTRTKLPLILLYVEICQSRAEARTIEKYFKSGLGREIIKELDNLS